MLVVLLISRLIFLLTMSLVNEDVRWLEPLFFLNNLTMIGTAFDYSISSPISSNASSPTMSTLNYSFTTLATVLSSVHRFSVLKWSVRIIGGLLIVIGGIGNTLSALTLSRKKLRAQVTSIYLIALALSDLGTEGEENQILHVRSHVSNWSVSRKRFLQCPQFLPRPLGSRTEYAFTQQHRL